MELVFYKEHLMQIATFHYHTVLKVCLFFVVLKGHLCVPQNTVTV